MNAAEAATYEHWHSREAEVLAYLRKRGFSPKGAKLAMINFVETMCYVARETGQVGFAVTTAPPSTIDLIEGILSESAEMTNGEQK